MDDDSTWYCSTPVPYKYQHGRRDDTLGLLVTRDTHAYTHVQDGLRRISKGTIVSALQLSIHSTARFGISSFSLTLHLVHPITNICLEEDDDLLQFVLVLECSYEVFRVS